MDPRPLGVTFIVGGAVGALIAALADPLGIGEGNVFGWLQITGVSIGAVVVLLGVVIATQWVSLPGRPASRGVSAGSSSPQTTVVIDSGSNQEEEHPA
jgi:hypothetical protein